MSWPEALVVIANLAFIVALAWIYNRRNDR